MPGCSVLGITKFEFRKTKTKHQIPNSKKQIYTKIYMICKIFRIDLLDFQGFNLRNFRKSMLFEYKCLITN
jgi:hypothetical protein